MTPGIGLALVAMVCFGLGDLVYKRAAAKGIAARHFIMVQAWVFCPLITLYALATGTLVLDAAAVWGAAAGLCALIGFYNFAQSLRSGSISTNAPIFRLNFTITATLAILLLGESLGVLKLAGLALALVAVWLLLADRGSNVFPEHDLVREPVPTFRDHAHAGMDRGSLARLLVATLCVGLANLFYKVGLLHGASPETILSAQAWTFCSLATAFVYAQDRALRPPRAIWRFSAAAGVLLLFGFVVLLHGLRVGPASVLIPVAQLGFVITALVGALLFGERVDTRKRLGLAVAAAALAVLAIS
jgi:drug/metabolite transporter (DMT)-like permease